MDWITCNSLANYILFSSVAGTMHLTEKSVSKSVPKENQQNCLLQARLAKEPEESGNIIK
jgi:hypothetical protein